MRSKTKKRLAKKRKFVSYISIIASAVFLGGIFFLSHQSLADVSGWGKGIWNNTLGYLGGIEQFWNATPEAPPAIGWLSSRSGLGSCPPGTAYSVHLGDSGTDAERPVLGKAWFGIGSRPDPNPDTGGVCDPDFPSSPGWLNFEAGSPSFCTANCYSAKWHKTGDGYAGFIDGWAKIDSMMQMPKPDGTFADNGWVELKNVQVDSAGIVSSGWGWNSGAEDTTIENNSGLGWINLAGLQINSCAGISCSTKKLCEGDTFGAPGSSCGSLIDFCLGYEGTDGICTIGATGRDWTCSNSCGSDSNSAFTIYPETGQCGLLNGGSICDPDNPPTAEEYCQTGTYLPGSWNSLTATWTCGKNQCGVDGTVDCSAATRCGWIETNP